jgi:tetratricopeptide (TPR) repeat protein
MTDDGKKNETFLEKLSRQASAILKILTASIVVAFIVIYIFFFIKDFKKSTVYIEPFQVPDDYAKNGFTGIVLANQIISKLSSIRESASTSMQSKKFSSSFSRVDSEIKIPGSDFSFMSLSDFFSKLSFGTQIFRGELYHLNNNLTLHIRFGNEDPFVVKATENQRDSALFEAAIYIYKKTQPYILAAYYLNKDMAKCERVMRYELSQKYTDGDPWVYNLMGLYYNNLIKRSKCDSIDNINNRKFQELSMDYFNKAIESDTNFAIAYNNLGNVYKNLKDAKNAEYNYNRAIKLDSNNSIFCTSRGDLYSKMQYVEKALADYDRATLLDNKNAEAYNQRGNLFLAQKKFSEALSDFNMAISLDSTNKYAYNNRGVLNEDLHRNAEAYRDFKKAIILDSSYYSPWENLYEYHEDIDHNHSLADIAAQQAKKIDRKRFEAFMNEKLGIKRFQISNKSSSRTVSMNKKSQNKSLHSKQRGRTVKRRV